MQFKLFPASLCAAFALTMSAVAFASQPPATEQVIHSFTGGLDGVQPASGLTLDKLGNLYGSTFSGGSANAGTIYKISRNSGGWTETVLYNFKGGTMDGANPEGSLLLGPGGQIVGTTLASETLSDWHHALSVHHRLCSTRAKRRLGRFQQVVLLGALNRNFYDCIPKALASRAL